MTRTRLAAVIGSPVEHSLSPIIHRAGFETLGVDWTYVAFDVAPGEAAGAIAAMRVLGIAGLSVTMPHKEEVAGAVDRLEPAAAALASVNTVSWEDGALVGATTDGEGFVASLGARQVAVRGRQVVVLGAGGAARSVIDALARAGARSVVVVNRTRARAEAAAALAPCVRVGSLADVAGADLVVNATSIGMGADPAGAGSEDLPCPPALIGRRHVVADLVYHPLRTAWLAAAEERGAVTVDGLGMLVHQAALQQRRWLGRSADVAVMRGAAESALGRAAEGRR